MRPLPFDHMSTPDRTEQNPPPSALMRWFLFQVETLSFQAYLYVVFVINDDENQTEKSGRGNKGLYFLPIVVLFDLNS